MFFSQQSSSLHTVNVKTHLQNQWHGSAAAAYRFHPRKLVTLPLEVKTRFKYPRVFTCAALHNQRKRPSSFLFRARTLLAASRDRQVTMIECGSFMNCCSSFYLLFLWLLLHLKASVDCIYGIYSFNLSQSRYFPSAQLSECWSEKPLQKPQEPRVF